MLEVSRRRPHLVIFDLDGTLTDSASDLAAAVDATPAGYGLRMPGEERARGWIGGGAGHDPRRARGRRGCSRVPATGLNCGFPAR